MRIVGFQHILAVRIFTALIWLVAIYGRIAIGKILHYVAVYEMKRAVLTHNDGSSHTRCTWSTVIRETGISLIVGKQRVYDNCIEAGIYRSTIATIEHIGTVDILSFRLGIVLYEVAGKHLQFAVCEYGSAKVAPIVAETAVAYLKRYASISYRPLDSIAAAIRIFSEDITCSPVAFDTDGTPLIVC